MLSLVSAMLITQSVTRKHEENKDKTVIYSSTLNYAG